MPPGTHCLKGWNIMEKANMKTFIGGLILLYSDTIKSLEKVQAVSKQFDGKVINCRYTQAVWDATKGEKVSICISKDSRRGWVYRTVIYAEAAWPVYGDAVYFGYQPSWRIPDECFTLRDGKAPRINGKALAAHLDREMENLSRRITKLEDYSGIWAAEVERYNRLCSEQWEIAKNFPCEMVDYIRRGKVGVRFSSPWRFD